RSRKLRRPRFSFFSYSIVKKLTHISVQKSNPKIRKPWEQTSHKSQSIVISLERSSPSPAAPPPSFSERTYKSIPTNKSTGGM
ncbi:hypothetical protein, partial [Rhizobium sp. CG4]|uniref:hypothetical protein n=1 Tax=Rhizobium sp. CG4 TaxID=2726075 RepID=UPI00203369C5